MVLAGVAAVASADVRLPKTLTDNMVLQRDRPIRVWGWAEPNEAVRVKLADSSAATQADAKGEWKVELPALKEGGNLTLTVTGRNALTLTNVIMGDVNWSGTAIEPWTALAGLEMISDPRDAAGGGSHAGAAHAVAVPQQPDAVERWLAAVRAAITHQTAIPPAPTLPEHPGAQAWCSMYNVMVHPLVRAPIKGALWYQGETNGGEGEWYYYKMRALIGGWRREWNQGDFPFYFVQLASFQNPNDNPAGGDGWSRLREAQTRSLAVANTGLAVIIDTVPLKEAGDIHPRNKYDVGLRLARWALNRDYGQKDIVVSGPIFKTMKIEDGKIRLSFDHVGSGLMVGVKEGRAPVVEGQDRPLRRFAIADEDKRWVWADAVIDGQTVVVSSDTVPDPVAVRSAFSMNPAGANLYNREGLPASPFRTDAW